MISYDMPTKLARLEATREQWNGGTLEIGTAGFTKILARYPLADPCADVINGELILRGMPQRATATDSGEALAGRIRNELGKICAEGLTVGDETTEPEPDLVVYPDAQIKSGQTVELMGLRFIHG